MSNKCCINESKRDWCRLFQLYESAMEIKRRSMRHKRMMLTMTPVIQSPIKNQLVSYSTSLHSFISKWSVKCVGVLECVRKELEVPPDFLGTLRILPLCFTILNLCITDACTYYGSMYLLIFFNVTRVSFLSQLTLTEKFSVCRTYLTWTTFFGFPRPKLNG